MKKNRRDYFITLHYITVSGTRRSSKNQGARVPAFNVTFVIRTYTKAQTERER